ncbi:cardiolipin synthase [Dyella sp.]|uniref:cardiolipin synthase n=1 Tax=Dyella sp. TaxID=1869338 RepID=UPI002ED2593B
MLSSIIGVIVLLFHLAGLIAAVNAVMNTRTAQGAFAWALGLIFLPYITLIPYLYLGRSKFHGYISRHRASRLQLREATGAAVHQDTRAEPETQRYEAIARMLGTRFLPGQRLRLLIDGKATFDAIFEAIDSARHYVLVQFFIFHDDQLGRRMQALLLSKAAQGVKVHVLFDGIGSHALPGRYIDALRDGGVAIHAFATRRKSNRFQLNFRNHRKIVVVDGRIGFTGGLNVGDEYMGLEPPLAPWRDTHLQIEGTAVTELQRSFAEDWYWVTGELPPMAAPVATDGPAMTLIAATGPADAQESCSLYFVSAIHAAQQRVWLTTPYFVPDQAVMAALRLAVFRGVDVRILIPSVADHYAVFQASGLYAHDAVRAGVRVFRHAPGFVHQKVILIDDDTVSVGSMNLDNRSFRLNFEIGALNIDRAFAHEVQTMLEHDFAQAREVVPEDYYRAPYLRRLVMHVARLFDPVL